jgi:hypothetical protein
MSKTRWHSCNVLRVGPATRQLWQFDAKGAGFVLDREETVPADKPLPKQWVFKDWRTLYQHKLNVAWLPPENVFLRVVQLPVASADETRAMVELQLEKLSPIPVTQVVWAIHTLPEPKDNQQTVVVILVAREVVEEFLGQLETQSFLADRLELSVLDQLRATAVGEDGAWIYAESGGPQGTALVAWWFGGVLRNLSLANLPAAGDRVAPVRQQLTQAAWAGELEGWLTAMPAWHLVADDATAREWEPVLRQALDEPIRVEPPQTADQLAGLTAHRAAQADGQASLLPPEFAKRYQQQFVDRLWMRGLLAIGAIYVLGTLIYFAAYGWVLYQKNGVEAKVKELGGSYTNALQLKARYQVLQDRDDLKFAALDCWKLVAELLPEGATLQSLDFADGRKLTLNGTCASDQVMAVIDFSSALKKAKLRDRAVFKPLEGDPFTQRATPGAAAVSWNFSLVLDRAEEK